ncbi:tetratricopeptide repeat protein [Streptomyces sp. NPDC052236]|uniref:tetratricopeptide repeat protein n=1 Tax=Streptomyces sp. NPDC052236 TaxID=3365686 RepID=UPI0037D1BB55
MEPTSQGARQGVHPFCGPCTDETTAWLAPDTVTVNGIGTIFYGAADPCSRCGSVVKRLYFCVLWIPVWPMGRFRIITLGRSLTGASYVGRRFPVSADNPYGLDKKTAELMALARAEVEEAAKSWPEPPPSQLADHPELRGERYQEAEDYWEFDFPDRALPVYEEVLAAHEAVLPADDTATLQLRQRVGEAYLAVGRPVAALALLQQTAAHLGRVLGPRHPDTRRAGHDMTNALNQLGLSRDNIKAIAAELAEVERTLGPDHPKALRTACALGSAQLVGSRVLRALEVLEETLDRSERALGADHPDTGYVREELIKACEFAEYRDKPDEVRAAARAQERLHGPDAPETLEAMRGLAQLYASSRRHRGEAVELLRDTLERCERALGPDDPLTADVRRQLEELN